jgi:hypothetical protein
MKIYLRKPVAAIQHPRQETGFLTKNFFSAMKSYLRNPVSAIQGRKI